MGAVVVTGSPPAFCAGADLSHLGKATQTGWTVVGVRRIPARGPIDAAHDRGGERRGGGCGHEPRARMRRTPGRTVCALRHPLPQARAPPWRWPHVDAATRWRVRRPRRPWSCSARCSTALRPRLPAWSGAASTTTSCSSGRVRWRRRPQDFPPRSCSAPSRRSPPSPTSRDHDEAVQIELSAQLWSLQQPEFAERLAAMRERISKRE